MAKKYKDPINNPYKGNANTHTQDFINKLCIEWQSSINGGKPAAKSAYDASVKNTNSRLCFVTKADDNLSVYRQLDNCVATQVGSGADSIKTAIDALSKDEDGLKKKFDEVLKAVKDANKKLDEVKTAAQALQSAYEDAGNTDARQALHRAFPDIKKRIDDVVDKADDCNSRIDDVQEEVVITIGKQTFLNIKGLTDFVSRLGGNVKLLTADVADNIKNSTDHAKDTQTKLTDAIRQQATAQITYFDAAVLADGLTKLKNFICTPNQPKQPLDRKPDRSTKQVKQTAATQAED
ncbi:hypothetical protein [Spirosoma panaciterrae]|uniref:hypothetical protein n=1 Tax=Spirosoma panaciterrae TaxID=496058 RepID=UPI00036C4039|nr:hypothetical protein [Spirosoma panaciterrae]